MSGDNELGPHHRLALRAYPKGPRRNEIEGTLIEAGAGRVANLVRHGLRARLGRPGRRGVVVIAVLLALVTGFFAAAAVTRVAWELVPGYPAGSELQQINDTIYPGLHATGRRDGDGLFFDVSERSAGEVFLHGHDEDFAFSTVEIGPDGFVAGDYPSWTGAAQSRLVTAGWQVSDAEVTGARSIATDEIDDSGRSFTATRGGLAITFYAETDVVDTPAGSFYTYATLDRLTPWWVTLLAVLGWLAGGLLGWIATGWVSRRTEHASGIVRSLGREPVIVALLLLVPQALAGVVLLVADAAADGPPFKPFWNYSLTYAFGCATLGLVLLAVSVLAAVFGGRPAPDAVAS